MHAATAASLAEVYKATKASCAMVERAEQTAVVSKHLAVDSAATLIELHDCCQQMRGDVDRIQTETCEALQHVAADNRAQQQAIVHNNDAIK